MQSLAYASQNPPATDGDFPPLLKNRDDKLIPNLANCCSLTAHRFPDTFKLNSFTGKTEVHCPLPSPVTGQLMAQDGQRELIDSDYTSVSAALARAHGLNFSVQQVSAAIEATAQESAYHPIRDYLRGLQWDGAARLDTWMSDYLGAEDTPYTAGIGRLFMIGMVARIMQPGCKNDYMLILEGSQGIRKSTACKVLAGGGRYFSDSLPPIRDANKDLSQHLAGKWLIELAEMSATSRADTEAMKAFLTRTHETYRPAYGRNEITQPRQCVFIGTTNRQEYLRDATGDRRFWPVKCGTDGQPIDIESLREHRDQLFAEAYHLYQHGEKWWPDAAFEAEHILPQQAERFERDPWEEMIQAHVQTAQPDRLTVAGLLTQVIDKKAPTRADSARVKATLQRLGYVEGRTSQTRYWSKPQ